MSGTLYTFPDNFRAQKILITANFANNSVKVDSNFVVGETNKSEEFLKKFPLGKVPAFENNDVRLSQTNAIAYYVGNDQTRGGDLEAFVLQWVSFADNEVLPHACNWVYPTKGILQYNKQSTEAAKEAIKKFMSVLNDHLSTRTWLVGERVSQADISVSCTFVMLYVNVLEPSFRNAYPNVNRWFLTAVNQPQFKSVLGEVKLCEKMAQFDAKKFNEIKGKGKQDQAGGDTKKAPKKATPAAKPAKKPLEQAAAKPVEKKDPWGHLPETSFDMDAWKRCYSNNDGDVALKYFWEHYDKEKYSIWTMKYKYNEELKLTFMAANLIGGMYQRIEKLRKHCFSNCLVLKNADGGLEIEGVWFWRGHDLAFELSPDWQVDYGCFDWVKMDPDTSETKEKVEEFWKWEGGFDGREYCDGKTYK